VKKVAFYIKADIFGFSSENGCVESLRLHDLRFARWMGWGGLTFLARPPASVILSGIYGNNGCCFKEGFVFTEKGEDDLPPLGGFSVPHPARILASLPKSAPCGSKNRSPKVISQNTSCHLKFPGKCFKAASPGELTIGFGGGLLEPQLNSSLLPFFPVSFRESRVFTTQP